MGAGQSSGDFIAAAHALRSGNAPSDADVIAETYWLRLFPEHALPALEIFSVVQPEHIRQMRARNPRNLALVVLKVRLDCGEGGLHGSKRTSSL